jgi:membrane peptidoglycan carboxypeptidase
MLAKRQTVQGASTGLMFETTTIGVPPLGGGSGLARARAGATWTAGWWPQALRVRTGRRPRRARRSLPAWLWVALFVALLLGAGLRYEIRSSALQSWLFSGYASRLSYTVGQGPSSRIVFPKGGPLDERHGHTRLPRFRRRLESAGYRVTEQAEFSPLLTRLTRWGISPPFWEPPGTGLVIRDLAGVALYEPLATSPRFERFEHIPPLLVRTLLFIENRELEEPLDPRHNPAVDWERSARAGLLYAGHQLGLPLPLEGGSTLATQIEKYQHSPHGRTRSALDKLRQMTSASLKAYREGSDTREERQNIVLHYLNTMPLAAVPGRGEVHGLGEGLRAWFGMELDDLREALARDEADDDRARAFKHVLALLYAVRAPSHYLLKDRQGLESRVAAYTRLLGSAGVIDGELARRVGLAPLAFVRPDASGSTTPGAPRAHRKAVNGVRRQLLELLEVRDLHELDRLHLEVETTLDAGLQEHAARLFRQLRDPGFLASHGLLQERLLSHGDPRDVVYSLMLFETTPQGNLLRVHADNLDGAFDVNRGTKLELGSTAKLRTLAHYLDLVARLHGELRGLDRPALRARARSARDPITRWAARMLLEDPALGIEPFLEEALERKYSASPHEVFFTGGGAHTFHNFDPVDDARTVSVKEAFTRSTNLAFIRLMRDLVRFHEARLPYDVETILEDPDHPLRPEMLREVADEEARQILARAYRRLRNLPPGAVVSRLLGQRATSPRHLTMLFFAWNPGADREALARWLAPRVARGLSEDAVRRLARAYGNPGLTLADHGYLLGLHPLEVWSGGQLAREPDASWDEILARSVEARRIASAWLHHRRHRAAQELRLRARFEREAFARMEPEWKRLGFPFERLVPSYATAIGSSSDRPAALAELVGILVNDGVRRPARVIRGVRFAPGTPYHMALEPAPEAPGARGEQRVLPAPVARALRALLAEAVERGTARRASGAFRGPDGSPIPLGGKTGSGDNRFETYAGGGQLVASRAVSRTAAFVFYVGDRYYGVITASVTGPKAAQHRFTSALPLAGLRLFAPAIEERYRR